MKKNADVEITANEINKYSYCPYQWYYGKVYGDRKLRQMKKELNERLGLNDTAMSNLVKGQKFHERHRYLSVGQIAVYIIAVGLILAAAIMLYSRLVIG